MDKGLDIAERRCVLAFHAAAPDSRRKLAKFAREFVSARSSGESVPRVGRRLGGLAKTLKTELDWAAADRALRWVESPRRQIVTIFDPDYPALLREIPAPPIVLFAQGNFGIIDNPQIAMVGSRAASHYGLDAAFQFARMLGARGFTITSGLAAGIDGSAHRGALSNGSATVAVYGCGIDRVYPRRHRELAEEICLHGVVVSEFPIGSPPRPYHFPRRNRIISGLSYGTMVIEAAAKSGSISTAIHALEQGREVFALPGSIRNPLSVGCHQLIKQGATIVTDITDVIDQLPVISAVSSSVSAVPGNAGVEKRSQLSSAENRLLEACAFDPATFDEIVQRSGLTATEVSSILSALEVRGLVRSLAGNAYLQIVT